DCGELKDGIPYLVMEHLAGQDLRQTLAQSTRLDFDLAAQIIHDACEGLSCVHAAGIVHRDLKPANLFLARNYSGRVSCKILDFGVVKVDATDPTREGSIVGTIR